MAFNFRSYDVNSILSYDISTEFYLHPSTFEDPEKTIKSKLEEVEVQLDNPCRELALTRLSSLLPSLPTSVHCEKSMISKKAKIEKIDKRDAKRFRQFFLNLNETGNQKESSGIAKRLLAERVDELYQPTPLREKYEFVLQNLKLVYPFLNTYFSKSKEPGEGIGKNVIAAKGVQHIVKQLERKNAFHGCDASVCFSFEDFSEKLQQAFKDKPTTRCIQHCFILRHRHQSKPKEFINHTTPIYMEKSHDVFEIFITDSGGGVRHWTENIITFLNEEMCTHFPESQTKIYHYSGKKRQSDFTSCPIFSIRDIVHMTQDPNMLKWMRAHGSSSQEKNIFAVPFLHPKMMTTCQSLSYIDDYLKATHTKDTKIYSKSKPLGKTLKQITDKHTHLMWVEKEGKKMLKKQNLKIAHLYLKYERSIIADAIVRGA